MLKFTLSDKEFTKTMKALKLHSRKGNEWENMIQIRCINNKIEFLAISGISVIRLFPELNSIENYEDGYIAMFERPDINKANLGSFVEFTIEENKVCIKTLTTEITKYLDDTKLIKYESIENRDSDTSDFFEIGLNIKLLIDSLKSMQIDSNTSIVLSIDKSTPTLPVKINRIDDIENDIKDEALVFPVGFRKKK